MIHPFNHALADAARVFEEAEKLLQERMRITKFGSDDLLEWGRAYVGPSHDGKFFVHLYATGKVWKDPRGHRTMSQASAYSMERAIELIDEGSRAADAHCRSFTRIKKPVDKPLPGSDHGPDYTHPHPITP